MGRSITPHLHLLQAGQVGLQEVELDALVSAFEGDPWEERRDYIVSLRVLIRESKNALYIRLQSRRVDLIRYTC